MIKKEGEKGPSVVVVVLRPSVCPVVRPVDVVRPLSVRPRPSVVVARPLSVRPVELACSSAGLRHSMGITSLMVLK